VYVANQVEKPRKRDCLSLWIVLVRCKKVTKSTQKRLSAAIHSCHTKRKNLEKQRQTTLALLL
jgi:hypothetical protein